MKALSLLLSLALVAVGCSKKLSSLPEQAASAVSQLANPSHSQSGQAIVTAQFSPDGKRIVVASKDGTARIWDAKTGQPLPLTNGATMQVWDLTTGRPVPSRYQPDTPDNMPVLGPDNFQRLQDQIDALEKRIQELEKNLKKSGR